MNNIKKIPISRLGYGFIPDELIPKGLDEYYLRNKQNRNGIDYRQLTAYEIEVLVRNRNTSDNWNNLLVSDAFTPELVKNCKFYGLVRIGKLEPYFLEFSQLKVAVGLYNSTIISCDFGDNVVVDNVNYLSHYIIGSEAIIANVNELMTTPHAKFGNGIVKQGESEDIRIWMELANENGGRKVIPFNGMLPGDAWMWSKYRDDEPLLEKFKQFTENQFDVRKGYYGKVGDRTVIKNCAIIKDVWIGSDAYLKGANKLKNLTINSKSESQTQIGEGCEMVNGIIGFGCRAFYGVKAVRFVMSSNSQLKYGARLINAYLGDNATISCCEVLNSLIFPAHEQHHNNSFLCASVIMGQSNMAAGATIGSNHNSRSNDGEIIANRGFWPGLCVSLKHNSRFSSFTIIAKGDYPAELDIPLPFSLISQDTANNTLIVMPAYWFMYNMYALARNAWKYEDRDKRPDKIQQLEFDYLAPDTINEMLKAIKLLELHTGEALARAEGRPEGSENAIIKTGKQLLETDPERAETLTIIARNFENSRRQCLLTKVPQAYAVYKRLIKYYTAIQITTWCKRFKIQNPEAWQQSLPANITLKQWLNVGGQLVPKEQLNSAIKKIKTGKILDWEGVHRWYGEEATRYPEQKCLHAFAAFKQMEGMDPACFSHKQIVTLMKEAIETRKWLLENMHESRKKDHTNPYRTMVYDSAAEMDKVIGRFEDNSFLIDATRETRAFEQSVKQWLAKWK